MWKSIVLFLVLFSGCQCQTDEEIEYYVNLIQTKQNEAFKLNIPKDNRHFLGGKTKLNEEPIDVGEYDFIVVGAGSSGSVMANRLTEISEWNVLLIEAGGKENNFTDIPNELLYSEGLPTNWGYYTEPQTDCFLGMKGNRWNYPRGKVTGGSSAINALIYARGNKLDYDLWEKRGNPGWSYKDVLPYFKRSEDSHVNGDPGYHGTGGLLDVDYTEPKHPMIPPFLEAHQELGYEVVDYNGDTQIGSSRMQMNVNHGRRASAGRAFLDPVIKRNNLMIRLHCLVIRVIIDKNKVATGVLFVCDGVLYKARVKKEVIVSGGAVNSPQLLMLSGIGPKSELKKFGINVLSDLPVGYSLRDHPTFFGLTFRTNYTFPSMSLREQIREYLKGKGPLTSAGNSQAIAFIQVDTRSSPKGYPDIEYVLIPQISINNFSPIQYNFKDQVTKSYLNKVNVLTDIRFYVALLHPISSGRIRLPSADWQDYPRIDLNLFSDRRQNDIKTMVAGIRAVLRLIDTKPYQAYNATLLDASIPGCKRYRRLSQRYWECFVGHTTGTFYHATGTTKMGPNEVVNHELKVYGIKNLRVVDCGIIPFQPSGHTNAIASMIAEKASDLIKQFWK